MWLLIVTVAAVKWFYLYYSVEDNVQKHYLVCWFHMQLPQVHDFAACILVVHSLYTGKDTILVLSLVYSLYP